jgi:transmembrane sensor
MTGFPLKRAGQPEPASVAATEWVLRQEEGELNESNKRRFADWLAEDPGHVAAYEDALWALDAVSRHAGEPEILALRNAALGARGSRGRLWWWTGAFGLVVATLAGLVLWTASPIGPASLIGSGPGIVDRPNDTNAVAYHTDIGERSVVALPDGSVATLDTDSHIRVAYTIEERAVYLVKGQALFDVAHDKRVPFQVYAKGQRITAVGTIFNVRIEGEQVKVSMVEGSVKVRTLPSTGKGATAPIQELTLSAGELAVAETARPMVVRAIDARQVATWKGGLLVFNDTRLSQAVAEINRYNTQPIAIADTEVGAYRVSGVFKSNDPEFFSRAMAEVLPIQVVRASDGSLTLAREENKHW